MAGTFSTQKDTWSCKSDLNMGNYDPYPELQNPKGCSSTENYCNCSMKDCGLYNIGPNKIDANYAPLQQSIVMSGVRDVKETYDSLCCRTTPYSSLSYTWNEKEPYEL